MAEVIVNLVLMIPFLIMGFVFSKGKGASLIAGYNTMSESKKAQYDETALCKFMGKVMYGVSFCLLLFSLNAALNMEVIFWTGMILLFALILFTVVYMNTGDRFKKGL